MSFIICISCIKKNYTLEKKKDNNLKYVLLFVMLFLGICLFFVLNICIGSVKISFSEILGFFSGKSNDDTVNTILYGIRLPRTLAVLILGGALSLAGFLLQTFFHNPIAGPFVLGISSGAKMCVASVMVFFLSRSLKIGSITLILSAFAGALICTGFVLLMTRRVNSMAMLIVCGVMIGYICSAITELVVTFASDADIVNLHNWSRGSFSGETWDNVRVMSIIVFICFVLVFLLSKPLGAYLMGESFALEMGVNIKKLRFLLVLFSSLLSACIVAFAGPVSFVGVASPHLIRKLFGTEKPVIMIPACFMGGSVFCLFCDLLARNLLSPTELNISTVTAIFGAPIVIMMMVNDKKKNARS